MHFSLICLLTGQKNRQNLPIWRNFFNCGQTHKNANQNPLKILQPCGCGCAAFLNDYRSRLQIYHAFAAHTHMHTHTQAHTHMFAAQKGRRKTDLNSRARKGVCKMGRQSFVNLLKIGVIELQVSLVSICRVLLTLLV